MREAFTQKIKNARLIRAFMRAAVKRRKLRENFTRKNKITNRIQNNDGTI